MSPRVTLGAALATRALAAALLAAALLPAACSDDGGPAARPSAPAYAADGSIEGVKATSTPSIVVIDVAGARVDAVGGPAGKDPLLPTVAKFLADSTSFSQAATPASWDVPALACLLTGLGPGQHNVIEVFGRLAPPLIDAWPTLPEILRAQGWRTAAFSRRGSNLSPYGLSQGFSEWEEAWSGGDDAGLGRVRAFLSAAPAQPVFLLLRPTLGVPAEASGTGDQPLSPERAREAYAKAAREVDGQVERLLALLRDAPATKDAIVVVTASHGYALGERGGRVGPGRSVFDEVVHVPLGIRAKGLPRGPVAGSCSLLDVTPTLLDLVGLPVPSMVGRSLAPLAAHPASAGLPSYSEDWAPLEMKPPGVRRIYAVRSAKGKFVARLHVASRTWDEQFFDLETDPGETKPLTEADPARWGKEFAAAVGRLREVLKGRVAHYEEVGNKGYFVTDDD